MGIVKDNYVTSGASVNCIIFTRNCTKTVQPASQAGLAVIDNQLNTIGICSC